MTIDSRRIWIAMAFVLATWACGSRPSRETDHRAAPAGARMRVSARIEVSAPPAKISPVFRALWQDNLGYCLIAAVLPMWMLLQPRGHLGGYFLYAAVIVAAIAQILGM